MLGTEDLHSKVRKSPRPFLIQSLAQDAARFLLHRASVFRRTDSQSALQADFKVPYRDACHQFYQNDRNVIIYSK